MSKDIHKGVSHNLTLTFMKFILLPVLLILFALVIISYFSFNSSKEQIQSFFALSLKQYSSEVETRIQNTINISSGLQMDASFMSFMSSRDISQLDSTAVNNVLNSISNTYPEIENAYIYSPSCKIAVDRRSKYPSDDFYRSIYSYESYSASYWSPLVFYDASPYRILSPSVVHSNGESKEVLPVVFRQIGNTRFQNFLVLNLSIDYLLSYNDIYKSTPNTKIYILNKFNGQLFSSNDEKPTNILDTKLYQQLITEKNSFNTIFNKKKHFIVAVSTTNNLLGYSYFAAVPFSDIHQIQRPFLTAASIITVLIVLLVGILAFHFSKKLAQPLQQITEILDIKIKQNKPKNSYAFLESIKDTAADLFEENLQLKIMLPLAQSNYLINYLNSTDYTINDDTQEIIKRSLPFKYDFFAVVVLQMYPTEKFSELYDSAAYSQIQVGFYDLVRELFSSKSTIFSLPTNKESIYILLNVTEDFTSDSIEEVLNTIYVCLKNDAEYINLYVGKSGIYEGLTGLKAAHTEATSSLDIILNSASNITVQQKRSNDITLEKNYENKLFNALVSMDIQKARELIDSTMYSQNPSIDSRSLKQLYFQILLVIFKVMKIKNIPIDNNRLDFEIFSDILNKDADEIYRKILICLDNMVSLSTNTQRKSGGDNMIEYINANFSNPNISLEEIAAEFNTTPSYVSQIVKSKLGLGFYKYLTGLRLDYAKNLLASTDLSVQEICIKSGFNSKQTFFRTFKTNVGMTPSAYRKFKE